MRLLRWPRDLHVENMRPINGPLVASGGSVAGNTNAVQTRSKPGFRWEFSFTFPVAHDIGARRLRGWIMGLQGGANVTDYTLFDQHRVAPQDYGNVGRWVGDAVPWRDGQPWSNEKNWRSAHPMVPVRAAIDRFATTVSLPDQLWGYHLDVGDWVGFWGHRGAYMITEIVGDGLYRVFPRIDAAIAASGYATLHPRLALKLSNPGAASMAERPRAMVDTSVTMVQVTHSEMQRAGLL